MSSSSSSLSCRTAYRSSPSGRSSGLHPVSSHSLLYVCFVLLFCSAICGGPIGVHHLWARPCFSSSVLYVWFRLNIIIIKININYISQRYFQGWNTLTADFKAVFRLKSKNHTHFANYIRFLRDKTLTWPVLWQ